MLQLYYRCKDYRLILIKVGLFTRVFNITIVDVTIIVAEARSILFPRWVFSEWALIGFKYADIRSHRLFRIIVESTFWNGNIHKIMCDCDMIWSVKQLLCLSTASHYYNTNSIDKNGINLLHVTEYLLRFEPFYCR